MRIFLPGLALGSAIDLGLHFAIGFAGSNLLAIIVAPAPILVIVLLAALGLVAWFALARRRRAPTSAAINGWTQATCPVCLALASVAPTAEEPAVHWQGAA
jgi:hypothetical protein